MRVIPWPLKAPNANGTSSAGSRAYGGNASTGSWSSVAANSSTSSASTSATTTRRARTARSIYRHPTGQDAFARGDRAGSATVIRRRELLGGLIHEYEAAAA